MIPACRILIAGVLLLVTLPVVANDIATADDVIPILQRRCSICHGGEYQDGELDLRTIASITKGGKSGSAIKVGNADGSLLIQKMGKDEMPPNEDRGRAGIEVTPVNELETLKRWINGGAIGGSSLAETEMVESDLWSLQLVRRPSVPKLKNGSLVANPIDAFLLRKLGSQGLSFSQPAKPETLLRRLALGATGLPPSLQDMEAFRAGRVGYADLVDQMLASDRYGERWGRFWLECLPVVKAPASRSPRRGTSVFPVCSRKVS